MPLSLFRTRSIRGIRTCRLAVLFPVLAGFLAGAPAPAKPPTVGRLDNGLTYYILPNSWPAERVSLRLAVRAGSAMEDDDQRGLAHVLEHMMFQGTKSYPHDVVPFMERHGAELGPDVNAYTSYDRTVYKIDLPSAPDSVVDVGLRLLAGFAAEALLDEEALETERGVVIEEWRQRRTGEARVFGLHDSTLYRGSRRAGRRPIGEPEILRSFPISRLRDFYRDWYRPERTAVIVVGDISVPRIEAAIRQLFGGWSVAAPSRPEPDQAIPPHGETLISLAVDPEVTRTTIDVCYRRYRDASPAFSSIGDMVFDDYLRTSLAWAIKRESLESYAVARWTLGPGTRNLNLRCGVKSGGTIPGLFELLLGMERLAQHEVSVQRLAESRDRVRAEIRTTYENRSARPNDELAEELELHFLDGGPLPDIESTFANLDSLLSEVTVEAVADLLDQLILQRNRLVLISAPTAEDLPDKAEVEEALAEIGSTQVEESGERRANRRILPYEPKAGSITGRRRIEELDATVLTLSNGAEVWLKPLMDRPDEVLFAACAPGGLSLAKSKDFAAASMATDVAWIIGSGGFLKRGLERTLGERQVRGHVYISRTRHGLQGSTTPRDVEAAFELIHGTFREMPSRDYVLSREGFLAVRESYRRLIVGRNPEAVLQQETSMLATEGHYLGRNLNEKDLSGMSSRVSNEFYRTCFANGAEFRFVLTGAFTEDAVTPLIEKYLASIPSDGVRRLSYVDRGLRFTGKTRVKTVEAGHENQCFVSLTFPTPVADRDPSSMARIGFTRDLLAMRLRDVLREERGNVYSLRARTTEFDPMADFGMTTFQFGCAPELADSLAAVALEEIGRWRTTGPEPAYMERLKATRKADWQEESRSSGYWLSVLEEMSLGGGESWTSPDELIDSLTPEMVREDLLRDYSPERYTQVIVKPVRKKK